MTDYSIEPIINDALKNIYSICDKHNNCEDKKAQKLILDIQKLLLKFWKGIDDYSYWKYLHNFNCEFVNDRRTIKLAKIYFELFGEDVEV